ncbi:MAG TPA: hypothetical protein VF021_00625, partial [Longimicrobiales bacterium]
MKAPILLAFLLTSTATAQQVTRIDYSLRIDTTSAARVFAVEMRIHNAPASFTLAAAAHPEYDDKYWQFIEEVRADQGTVTRMDSVLWRFTGAAGDVTVRYQVRPPAPPSPRSAWRAF